MLVKDWVHILADPDEVELARMIRVGETVTWPKVRGSLYPESDKVMDS